MTQQVRAALIIGGGLIVAALIALVAVLLTRDDDPATAAPTAGGEEARVLPDGTTATEAQDAYLDAVEPHLSPDRQADVLAVLSSGESYCTIWLDPSDPAIQEQGTQLLIESSGYTLTEATAIASAAAEHLCPEK